MQNIENIKKESSPLPANCLSGEGVKLTQPHMLVAARTSSSTPCMYRQVRYGNDPTTVLQGGYRWQHGWDAGGIEWVDMPIEQLPAREQEKKQ